MRPKFSLICLWAAFFTLSGKAQAVDKYAFANHLFAKKDFYRAWVEYQRVYFNLTGKEKSFGQIKAAESLYLGGEFSKVKEETATIQPSDFRLRVNWLNAFALANTGQFEKAHDALSGESSLAAIYQTHLWRLNLAVDSNRMPTLPRALLQTKNKILQSDFYQGRLDITRLRQLSSAWPRYHDKSPWLAAILSGILPGAGQMYNGYFGDGFSSFFIVSLFAGLSTLAFLEDEKLLGAVAAGTGFIFYGGSIYGAYNGSKAHNKDLRENYQQQLKSLWLKYEALRF